MIGAAVVLFLYLAPGRWAPLMVTHSVAGCVLAGEVYHDEAPTVWGFACRSVRARQG